MMTWTFTLLWPLVGLIISVLGWLQVRRSEGTQAGGRLATWGMVVSILGGLVYLAYVFGSTLAITQLAEGPANEWFALLKEGKVEEAFIRTLPPEQRPTSPVKSLQVMREELNSRFGGTAEPGRRAPGQFDTFLGSDLTRQLAQAGAEAKIQFLGTKEKTYENNGYLVRNIYRVTTPFAEFEALVTLNGVEKKGRAGWDWQIRQAPDTGVVSDTLRLTDLGKRIAFLSQTAGLALEQWNRALTDGNTAAAFLLTREPSERDALAKSGKPLEEWQGFKDYTAGGLIKVDPETFMSLPRIRGEIPTLMRKSFETPDSFRFQNRGPTEVPFITFQPRIQNYRWSQDQDRFRILCPVEVTVAKYNERAKSTVPRYALDCVAVMETSAAALTDPNVPPTWRLVELDLRRAMEMSSMMPGQ
jgi:hypothetical protein